MGAEPITFSPVPWSARAAIAWSDPFTKAAGLPRAPVRVPRGAASELLMNEIELLARGKAQVTGRAVDACRDLVVLRGDLDGHAERLAALHGHADIRLGGVGQIAAREKRRLSHGRAELLVRQIGFAPLPSHVDRLRVLLQRALAALAGAHRDLNAHLLGGLAGLPVVIEHGDVHLGPLVGEHVEIVPQDDLVAVVTVFSHPIRASMGDNGFRLGFRS